MLGELFFSLKLKKMERGKQKIVSQIRKIINEKQNWSEIPKNRK